MSQVVPIALAIAARTIYVNNTNRIPLLLIFSRVENLYLALAEFIMILVSCPEKIVTPMTHSVFLNLHPLNIILSAPKGIFLD